MKVNGTNTNIKKLVMTTTIVAAASAGALLAYKIYASKGGSPSQPPAPPAG